MLKIAVLVSGGGSNLQAIIDKQFGEFVGVSPQQNACTPLYKVEMVIGSKDGIYGLERAENAGIPSFVVSRKEYGTETSNKILELTKGKVDLIVLAGYLSILDGELLREFRDRIINVHPSLIPSFAGEKMYGMNVHNAVRKSGVKFTGCTVHFVNEEVDGGAIILQEAVPVYFEDTAEDIQKRVLVQEHRLLPMAIELLCEDKIRIVDGRVNIIE